MRALSAPLLICFLGALLLPPAHGQPAGKLIDPAMKAQAVLLSELALTQNHAYSLVESLTTEVGPRPAGTPAEARALDWAVRKLTALGFSHVRVEPFQVPMWRRGEERADILSPYPQSLTITGLGGSAGGA